MKPPDKRHKQDVTEKGIDMPPFTAVGKPTQVLRKLFDKSRDDAKEKDGKPSLPCTHPVQTGKTDRCDKRQYEQCKQDIIFKNIGEGSHRKRIQLLFY
jgi:hypothetical protein